jgi:hypothetical protein
MTSSASSNPGSRSSQRFLRPVLLAIVAAAFLLVPTAQASAADFLLEVNVTGEGNVGCKANGGPIEGCEAEFEEGTQVTVIAEPETGSEFLEWLGECDSTSENECEVEMNADKTIEAVFGFEELELAVETEGNGEGVVECEVEFGPTEPCLESESYPYGSEVTLYAVPAEGSEFVEWGGDCAGPEPECNLTLEEPLSVSADFEPGPLVALNIEEPGTGEGTISCEANEGPAEACQAEYPQGTQLRLVAKAQPGSEFVEWGGECDVLIGNECEVEITEEKTLEATFDAKPPVSLTVNLEGEGEGEVQCEVNSGPLETCEAEYPEGTELALVALAETGSEFAGFSAGTGSATGCATTPCEFTLAEDSTVTATFDLEPTPEFTLEVEVEGTGSGTVTSVPPGFECPPTCSAEFAEGTTVILVAEPDPGSEFVEWIGCEAEPSPGECEVTMGEDKEVIAVFDLIEFTLEVEVEGTGSGTVTSSPPGIDCGAECEAEYLEGEEVTLTAVADPGSEFTGWTGCDVEPSAEECEVTMDADKVVTATFEPEPTPKFTLKVKKTGTGTGKVESTSPVSPKIVCGSECEKEFDEGTKVTLSQSADPGSEFVKWTGACTGSGACEVTMSAAKEVTAEFKLKATPKFTLKVKKEGTGTGTVTSSPAGINCGATCSAEFDEGTEVTLSAAASAGSEFSGWSGGGCTGVGTCKVTMSAAKEVTATFDLEPPSEFALTVVPAGTGSGTVTSSPAGINCGVDCSEAYAAGTEVTLAATPTSGSTFSGWSGACTGAGACKVTMSQARSVTATFAKESPPPPPGTASVASTAKVKSGKALLKLTCKGEGPCKGSLKLTAKIKSGGKTKNKTIGKGSFSLAAGARATLKVKLSGPAKRAVAKKPLKAKVSGSGVRSSTVKLKK